MARRKKSKRRRRKGARFQTLYRLLSVLAISSAILMAITLFFRVDAVVIEGNQRYTEEEVQLAAGIQAGDNLFLLNKYHVAGGIVEALPYIEEIRIDRIMPDTISIQVKESLSPLAIVQDGSVWLVSASGKIVDQLPASVVEQYGTISGCQLLAPSVGTRIAMDVEYTTRRDTLLSIMAAFENAGLLKDLNAVRLDDLDTVYVDYANRFTLRLDYGADYPHKLRTLKAALASGKIQDNMTGTFDMRGNSGKTNFIQNVR